MAKIVEAKSMFGGMVQQNQTEEDTVMQISIYLEIMDLIDNCLNEYKEKCIQLKQVKLSSI